MTTLRRRGFPDLKRVRPRVVILHSTILQHNNETGSQSRTDIEEVGEKTTDGRLATRDPVDPSTYNFYRLGERRTQTFTVGEKEGRVTLKPEIHQFRVRT